MRLSHPINSGPTAGFLGASAGGRVGHRACLPNQSSFQLSQADAGTDRWAVMTKSELATTSDAVKVAFKCAWYNQFGLLNINKLVLGVYNNYQHYGKIPAVV